MSERKRPLPHPKKTAFGRRSSLEGEGKPSLIADDIVRAAAEGSLEKLFGKEIPDTEQARALVSMMMGMSGMSSFASAETKGGDVPPSQPGEISRPSEDVVRAAESGDVSGLMGLLRQEHQKRSGNSGQTDASEASCRKEGADPSVKPTVEKEVIDGLLAIASENQLALDWIVLRALKVYVRTYRDTGRL
jgi:hypothetical protein